MITKSLAIVISLAMMTTSSYAKTCGRASWYHEGARTANGEPFHPDGLTAAHRTIGIGSILDVFTVNRHVHVRINDRGPAAWTGRIIDLSRGAARELGMIHDGVRAVCYNKIGQVNHRKKRNVQMARHRQGKHRRSRSSRR